MIFEEVAEIMNQDTARKLSRKTGLTKDKVYRLSSGLPFVLDYNTVFALQHLGYEIRLEKLSHETDN